MVLLALGGCSWISGPEWEGLQDADGDGHLAPRFGGDDCRDDDPSVGPCDADGDGYASAALGGDDCADDDPALHPGSEWFLDADGDGFGDPATPFVGCEPPYRTVADATDCDDADGDIHPGADETCDPRDENCDPDHLPYDGADGSRWYVDADRDGYGTDERTAAASCAPGPGESDRPGDCDDDDADVFPGAPETWYDGRDGNCDLASDDDQDGDGVDVPADCDDSDPDRHPSAPERCNGLDDDCDTRVDDQDDDADQVGQLRWFVDADGDGHGTVGGATLWVCPGATPPHVAPADDDCNDADATVHPGVVEQCDGVDEDCNGLLDDGAVDAHTVYVDGDDDGWGDASLVACGLPAGTATRGGDCNDADPATWPGAPEVCGDAFRQDCGPSDPADCDQDGSAAPADCDDDPTHPHATTTRPGAPERCNGWDDDCDGLVDGDDPDVPPTLVADWYADLDGDGFGGPLPVATATCRAPAGAASNQDDCDDTRATAYPGAEEACNDLDDDCDGTADETPTVAVPTFWRDGDGDGYGDPLTARADVCEPPTSAWVEVAGDCRDDDQTFSPAAAEACDAADNDCDGLVDDADPSLAGPLWHPDDDRDGYGLAGFSLAACQPSPGWIAAGGDCADDDATRNPGAPEVCDTGVDDDCDGLADDHDPDVVGVVLVYRDLDGDRYGDPSTGTMRCEAGPDWVLDQQDCDDTEPTVHPGSREICDGLDDDCDGLVDLDDANVGGVEVRFEDTDQDGYGARPIETCDGEGVLVGGDCDDRDGALHPTAEETCDAVDEDCDGRVDDDPPNGPAWWPDADGDGVPRSPLAGEERRSCVPLVGYAPAVVAGEEDCDDARRDVFPGNPAELCNGRDDDCDVAIDEDPADGDLWWADTDHDHYGRGTPMRRCTGTVGLAANGDDCDDADDTVYPGHGCGTSTATCQPPQPMVTCWNDNDDDGWGWLSGGPVLATACAPPLVDNPFDCNDNVAGDVVPVDVTSTTALTTTWADMTKPCQVITLRQPFANLAIGTLVTPGTAYRRVIEEVPGTLALIPAALPLVTQSSTSSVVFLGVPVDLTTTPPASRAVFELTHSGAKLGLIDLDVDGHGRGGLIYQTQGESWLEGVTGANFTGTASGAHSASIVETASGIHKAARSRFLDATGEHAFELAGTSALTDVTLVRTPPVLLTPFLSTVTVADLAVLAPTGSGVKIVPQTSGVVTVDGLVVAGATADGVTAASTTLAATVGHATVVGNGRGVVGAATPLLTLEDAIVVDSATADLTGTFTNTSGVLYDTGSGATRIVGLPGFVTWSPVLDPETWDFHLGATSDAIGAGTGGDDLGRYRADDPWYCDSDGDGLYDGWELDHHATLAGGANGDADGDLLGDSSELAKGTDPNDTDTDGDTLSDRIDPTPLGI